MIKRIALSLGLIISLSNISFSQSHDVYIVINEADWCKYCKANGERIHTLIDEYALGKKVLVVSNDVTDEESKKKTEPKLEEIGVNSYMKNHKEAAVVFVFDANTKEILDKFSLKSNNEKVLNYLNKTMEVAVN